MSTDSPLVELDYLVIGHVTRDLVGGGKFTIGGTASYAARTALALGCRVGVVTSAAPDLDLGEALHDVHVARLPARQTTTFENLYSPAGRRQMLHGLAERLTPSAMPVDWRLAPSAIVHLGPVARECDPALLHAFGAAFIGVTPQGWMRHWDAHGYVHHGAWEEVEAVLARADAVVLSIEDVGRDETWVERYAAQTRLLVVTRGAAGCTVYTRGQSRSFPAPAVHEADPTGAGDIFAAAFFVSIQRRHTPWAAARFANCIAAQSVTRSGLASTPTAEEVAGCGVRE